ncbi:Membrane proteins related to metalloendopeptidases [Olavius sp. associated proteobacterium Delta 1]|nr:Membrane proteins related to metalloendopeptidases [Olavius sp. associated proteobacterium Delta 1]
MKKDKKHTRLWLILIGCLIIVVPAAWFLTVRLEGKAPQVEVDLISLSWGRSQEITISVSDADSGLRQLWVGLLKDGKEIVLHDETFPSAGLLKGGTTNDASVKIPVAPIDLGFSDGDAILRLVVRDYSWRDWWNGNKTYAEKPVVIDTRAPGIEVFTSAHNINQGGAGLVVYRTSETCSQSGVQVGNKFFPGHAGYFKDPNLYLAFFALGYEQGRDTAIHLTAADLAGNPGKSGFNYYIRRKKFRKDRINISDGFLKKKLPDFDSELPWDSKMSAVDRFLLVNRGLRQANYQKIVEVCRNTANKLHWRGVFLRLPNSANRARYADHRTYFYKKKEIDRQVHMGIDLASLANSPVPAANSGVVVFAEPLGIYGGTVIIDHGFGLFSMYSHLSFTAVKAGDQVSRGGILGRTGSTGMAGGDHLHFSMLINGTFVNPVEWWDKKWIENNVQSKIEQVKSSQK